MKKNKKGFTLIELLAVIVILGILLAIAIPNVTKYINSARKQTYITNVQLFTKAARNESINNNKFQLPVNKNDATVISFKELKDSMESGGKTSPYGGAWDLDNSYVMIVNEGSADDSKPVYYIAAIDEKGYAIGLTTNGSNAAALIKSDELKEENILQVGKGSSISYSTAATGKYCVRYVYTGAATDGALETPVGNCINN